MSNATISKAPFRLATWNVNSLRVRLPQVLRWLQGTPVDVLCLQETKLTDDKFPAAEIEQAGYRSFFVGQKTYNGVAILVRNNSLHADTSSVVVNNPLFADAQKRLLALTVNGLRVICAYVPNGEAVGSEKFNYKLTWLDALHQWLTQELQQHPRLVLLGDYNIAPEDRDVHDPKAWEGHVLVSPQERAHFLRLKE